MQSLTPAARRILETAEKLFYARGIHAVGVDTIAAAAGVTKKTLYDRFGSKDALVGHYLTRRDERWREHVNAVLNRHSRAAATERVLLLFDALGEWMAVENPRGCGFVNAHAELPDDDHPGRAAIRAQKQWLLNCFLEQCADLRSPGKLAESLLILFEGATVAASLGVAPDAVRTAKRLARRMLGEARR